MSIYPPLQKASTLQEIYHTFEGNKPLSEEEYDDFFVDIYQNKLKRFIIKVQHNSIYEKMFFIAGQQGNGKSTILNVLKKQNEKFSNDYEIRHLQTKDSFRYQDISIVDILFVIALDFLDNAPQDKKETLKEKFKDKLNELIGLHEGTQEKSQTVATQEKSSASIKANISLAISALFAKGSISANASYNNNKSIREEIKKIYKFNIEQLLSLVNTIILSYKTSVNNGKDILLMIDGLEKTTNTENITNVFLNDIGILKKLECFKIVTIPIYLKEKAKTPDVEIVDFTMEVDENCELKNKDLLKQIVLQRIAKPELITEEAIDLAVQKSGGNIRLLLNIIQDSAVEALTIFETPTIDTQEVQSAINLIGGAMSTTTQMNKAFLNKIHKNKEAEEGDDEILNTMIYQGLVFAYCNGKTRYDINPTVQASLE